MTFSSISEIFKAPTGDYFYASTSGETGHRKSYYASLNRNFERNIENQFYRDSSLCFDVSNQFIQASVDIESTIQEVRSAYGLQPYKDDLRGVYVQKKLIGGGPFKYELELSGVRIAAARESETRLLANLFPLTRSTQDELICQRLTFAPVSDGGPIALPVVIQTIQVTNSGSSSLEGNIILPSGYANNLVKALKPDEDNHIALYLFSPAHVDNGRISFQLGAGETTSYSIAIVAAASSEEMGDIFAALAEKDVVGWFNTTLNFHQARLGHLTVEDNYYGEALVRLEELCRQSELYLPDGSFAGGTLGSNVNPEPVGWWNTNVWMKDNFYAALPMAMFYPEMCEKAIDFYMKWGVPEKTWGRGVQRFPHADSLTQSLSNSLSGIVLAAAYYQMTGNRQFFLDNTTFRIATKRILTRVLASRLDEERMLFHSMYVSDGDARGDFHTGSNLVAWYAFRGMARIWRAVYQDDTVADEWQAIAQRIQEDLEKTCKGRGMLGEQYFEGAFRDGSFVACHDGEESDVALMPFYRYCEADDPALTRFSHLAFSSSNPYYIQSADGIAWYDAGWCCDSTFPGFTTALAGAENEVELLYALERIRRLTDLDGSIWWWPHKLHSQGPSQVSRWPVKCCWAAGVYILKFVNDVLGIQIDKPAQKIALRPFIPWRHFEWQACRLGNSVFDFRYEHDGQKITSSIINRNPEVFEATLDLTLPVGMRPVTFQINTENDSFDNVRFGLRYNRPSYRAVMRLDPQQSLVFTIEYAA